MKKATQESGRRRVKMSTGLEAETAAGVAHGDDCDGIGNYLVEKFSQNFTQKFSQNFIQKFSQKGAKCQWGCFEAAAALFFCGIQR